jgi:type II secretory pathway component PulJ
MDYTITSTARNNARRRGFTLVESVVAGGISVIVSAGLMGFFLLTAQSFSAIGNYATLDAKDRNALDTMSRDIRQANGCSTNAFSSTNLTLLMADPTTGQPYTINYNYAAASEQVTRTYADTNTCQTTILLNNCSSFAFSYFQRNPTNGAWLAFPNDADRPDECKLVQIDWICANAISGGLTNSESIQSAKVVIRKE